MVSCLPSFIMIIFTKVASLWLHKMNVKLEFKILKQITIKRLISNLFPAYSSIVKHSQYLSYKHFAYLYSSCF